MKMPTKAELLKLQKRYHTDKRIAEALGGNVTEHLVQYWRRKKGIPHRTFPKYSEQQIRELWERFGDDFRCGQELGLSKAGFYSWRRKYGIKEKPKALKLEQLELRFGSESKRVRNGVVVEYYMTAAGKILAEAAERDRVEFGEEIEAMPDLVLAGEGSAEYTTGASSKKIADKYRRVADLPVPASGNGRSANSVLMLLEEGVVLPNSLILHSGCEAGGLAAVTSLTLEIDDEKLRGLLRTGKCKVVAPKVVRITLEGRLQKGVAAFDIFSFAKANLDPDILKGMIVEYSGNVVEKLNMYERISLCHVTQNYGAACGYTVFDDTTRRFLSKRTQSNYKVNFSDSKAYYHKDFVLTLSGLEPQIVPCSDLSSSYLVSSDLEIGRIAAVFVGGPCGGSFEAMKQVSDVFKPARNLNIPFYLSPVSDRAYLRALKKKVLVPIVEAGGIILPPGFDLTNIPGFDTHCDEAILSTPNTTVPNPPKNLYFVNHLTAAASALAGRLQVPER